MSDSNDHSEAETQIEEISSIGTTASSGISTSDEDLNIKVQRAINSIEETKKLAVWINRHSKFNSHVTLIFATVVMFMAVGVAMDYFYRNPIRFETLINYVDTRIEEELVKSTREKTQSQIWYPYLLQSF